MLEKLDYILTHISYMDNVLDKKDSNKVIVNINYLKFLLNEVKYEKISIEAFGLKT